MSLVSRHLEKAGIATVVMGCARDVVEECGVSRFAFTDFPLGNPCGKPWDARMQSSILGIALDLLERAWMPRTTVQSPYRWENEEWRDNFMKVDGSNRAILARAGEERRALQAKGKNKK